MIGAGGFGEVFKAYDNRLGRTVAIKYLRKQDCGSPDSLAAFDVEAKALASISHPNVATLYEFERGEDAACIIMEYVSGKTLSQLLDTEELSLDRVIDTAVQISEALGAVHQLGLLHGDLKPSNVLVSDQERIKVLDFGLARHIRDAGLPASVAPSDVTGTIAYLSPEQIRGQLADVRSDLFALGVLLYRNAGQTFSLQWRRSPSNRSVDSERSSSTPLFVQERASTGAGSSR